MAKSDHNLTCEGFCSDQDEDEERDKEEGRGWKWIVLFLVVYIVFDKLGSDLGVARYSAVLFDEVARHPVSADIRRDGMGLMQNDLSPRRLSETKKTKEDSSHSEKQSSSPHDSEKHSSHPHDAMFFLVTALVVSAIIVHVAMVWPGMQFTVVLFLAGFIMALIVEVAHLAEDLGPWGKSYEMWVTIDPHLLLFSLLPPLLAGDAMSIDVEVVRKVAAQCMYLAGPGVAIQAFTVSGFLYIYPGLDWDFLNCLVLSSILCATDPVAVVALLKELGASPTLTVQIQGESLLNDGTAIVLYLLSYEMLKGTEYNAAEIFAFLIKMSLYAWVLGAVVGFAFLTWVVIAKNKFDHNSSLIQVSLTLACAYASFQLAEGYFKISGVLCTVSASLVLAWQMWPMVVCHAAMHRIWHVFEYLGNSVIFFLAGALVGSTLTAIEFENYLHLIVIYVVLTIVRFTFIFCSLPLLRLLSREKQPVTMADAVVMSWGGLRGAVGLALAIQVHVDGADGKFKDGHKALFFTGGIALMTLLINATTCPLLVSWLGITKTPEVKQKMVLMFHEAMAEVLRKEATSDVTRGVTVATMRYLRNVVGHGIEFDSVPGRGNEGMNCMLSESGDDVGCESRRTNAGYDGGRASNLLDLVSYSSDGKRQQTNSGRRRATWRLSDMRDDPVNVDQVVIDFKEARDKYGSASEGNKESLGDLCPAIPLTKENERMWLEELVQQGKSDKFDVDLLRAFNDGFLRLLHHLYWEQIKNSEIPSTIGPILSSSVADALSHPGYELNDLEMLKANVESTQKKIQRRAAERSTAGTDHVGSGDKIMKYIDRVVLASIIVCGVLRVIDLRFPPEKRSGGLETVFLVIEIIINVVFALEAMVKIYFLRREYFYTAWNLFEFFLVIAGWIAIVTGAQISSTIQYIFRLLKLFQSMTVLRISVFLSEYFGGPAKKRIDVICAVNTTNLEIYIHCIRAHQEAQKHMTYFFSDGQHARAELTRCLIQSRTTVYNARCLCLHLISTVPTWALEELMAIHSGVDVAHKFEATVARACASNLLQSSDAEVVAHTLHEHVQGLENRCEKLISGRLNQHCCLATKLLSRPSHRPPGFSAVSEAQNSDQYFRKPQDLESEAKPLAFKMRETLISAKIYGASQDNAINEVETVPHKTGLFPPRPDDTDQSFNLHSTEDKQDNAMNESATPPYQMGLLPPPLDDADVPINNATTVEEFQEGADTIAATISKNNKKKPKSLKHTQTRGETKPPKTSSKAPVPNMSSKTKPTKTKAKKQNEGLEGPQVSQEKSQE